MTTTTRHHRSATVTATRPRSAHPSVVREQAAVVRAAIAAPVDARFAARLRAALAAWALEAEVTERLRDLRVELA